jgi:zinc/manganese transport system substrate-binding protein
MKFVFSCLILACANPSLAGIRVVTTTTDLAAIARQVAGDLAEVDSLGKGTQDPHTIEPKPSFMVRLRSADLLLAQGLELETAWMDPLIRGARNSKLHSKLGVLELGPELDPIEVVTGKVSRADGDVHPGGNPHFQLDPVRVGQAAVLIAARMGEIDPPHKEVFAKNAAKFQQDLLQKTKSWTARIQALNLREIVAYHKTFSYFCVRFQITCSLQLEPKPGIPPTAAHLLDVIAQMKARQVRIVLIENLFEDRVREKLIKEIPRAAVLRAPVSVDGEPGLSSNELLIERLVQILEGAAK